MSYLVATPCCYHLRKRLSLQVLYGLNPNHENKDLATAVSSFTGHSDYVGQSLNEVYQKVFYSHVFAKMPSLSQISGENHCKILHGGGFLGKGAQALYSQIPVVKIFFPVILVCRCFSFFPFLSLVSVGLELVQCYYDNYYHSGGFLWVSGMGGRE